MPWHIVPNHSECPDSRPFAVVKNDGGEVEGCHETRSAAEDQLAALYASEPDNELADLSEELVMAVTMGKPSQGTPADRRLKRNQDRPPRADLQEDDTDEGDCPPGMHPMPDGECMPDTEMASDPDLSGMAGPFQGWSGVLAVEGAETGDGREFAPGSLEWPNPPLPLMWQRESEPAHGHSVVVGRIDRLERRGPEIYGWGVIDLGNPEGAEVARQMGSHLAGGVSVDVDSVKEPDVELVYPDDDEDERVTEDADNNIVMLFGPPPEKTVFHRGRIRGATLVALPAFVEARLFLVDDEEIQLALAQQTFAAIRSHGTSTSDRAWDGPANEARLNSPMSMETVRNAYAWVEGDAAGGEVPKSAARFIHHEVDTNGEPGAANLVACSTAIGVLNGGRGGTTIPSGDRQGVYNHLAKHLRDAGREPPPLMEADAVLVAAGGPVHPPDQWFQDPRLDGPTPWTIRDGRCFGHLALWSSCHTTFPNRCITPPREQDFPYFLRQELQTAEGELVGVGQVTMGTGHAPLQLDHLPAAEHYDDTGTAMADIAVGADKWGIWIAGGLRPEISDVQLRQLRAASLSGDWRRIGGRLRLVAVLAVNVPGYPIPRMRATLASDDVASLVAAGIPTEARRERYRQMNAERLSDGTIRVRRASMVATIKEE